MPAGVPNSPSAGGARHAGHGAAKTRGHQGLLRKGAVVGGRREGSVPGVGQLAVACSKLRPLLGGVCGRSMGGNMVPGFAAQRCSMGCGTETMRVYLAWATSACPTSAMPEPGERGQARVQKGLSYMHAGMLAWVRRSVAHACIVWRPVAHACTGGVG
eukprot:1146759-Pelagomonas_calceolata.AAC.3